MPKREPRFEVLWYRQEIAEDIYGNVQHIERTESKDFYTRKAALKFYEEHKNDTDKYGWWVTHRNANWEVIEDIIY